MCDFAKVQTADPLPYILEVRDLVSNTANEQITPGGVIQLLGGRLKLAAANPDNGIFLMGEQAGAVKLPVVVENKPSRLIAMIPADLPEGTYPIEVRTTMTVSGKEVKTLKTGRFNRELVTVHD